MKQWKGCPIRMWKEIAPCSSRSSSSRPSGRGRGEETPNLCGYDLFLQDQGRGVGEFKALLVPLNPLLCSLVKRLAMVIKFKI